MKKFSRRHWLLSSVAAISAAIMPWKLPAEARPIHGGVASGGGGPSTLPATVTLVNTTGSSIAGSAPAPTFGHFFKKGDIPTGQYPIVKDLSGTVIPATIYGQEYWSDGSLFWCGFATFAPAAGIAGSGSTSIKIYGGGSAPAASGRSLTDLTTSLALKVQVDGQLNLSGTWESNLANGISNTHQSYSVGGPDILVYADGPGGKLWRVRASFEQSGAAHGGLEGYWFIWARNDISGNLAGVHFLPQLQQPWEDLTSPAPAVRVFSAMRLMDGATTILDPTDGQFGSAKAATFVWRSTTTSDGNFIPTGDISSLEVGFLAMLTTTGGLPPGLSTGTPYIAYAIVVQNLTTVCLSQSLGSAGNLVINGSSSSGGTVNFGNGNATYLNIKSAGNDSGLTWTIVGTPDGSTPQTDTLSGGNAGSAISNLKFQTITSITSNGATASTVTVGSAGRFQFLPYIDASSPVTASGAGTGVHTLTAYPYLSSGTCDSIRQTTGRYTWRQGGGSIASDPTAPILTQWQQTYMNTTGGIPPWDYSHTPASSTAVTSFYNQPNPWENPPQGSTGETPYLGVTTNQNVVHYCTQALQDEQNVRQQGFTACMDGPFYWRNSATKHAVALGSTLSIISVNGSSYSGMYNAGNSWRNGNNAGAAGCDIGTIFASGDTSHLPNGSWYAYGFTAEPHLHDCIMMMGNHAVVTQYYRAADNNNAIVDSTHNTIGSQRNPIVNGTEYNGTTMGTQTRQQAWGSRDVSAAARWGTSHPENPNYGTYYMDMHKANFDAFIAFNAMNTTYVKNTGLFCQYQGNGVELYQLLGYCMMSWCWGASINEYSNCKAMVQLTCKWVDTIFAKVGGWHMSAYTTTARVTSDASYGPLISNDNQLSFNQFYYQWASGGHFTVLDDSGQGNLSVDNGTTLNFGPGSAPAGFPDDRTACYIVNKSGGGGAGTTFDLSLTLGGSPVTLTDTNSYAAGPYVWGTPTSTNCINGNEGESGFLGGVMGGLNFAKAIGCTFTTGVVADQQFRAAGFMWTYAVDVKYAIKDSFT